MIRESRPVMGKTIFNLLKQQGILFLIGSIFTLIPFAVGSMFLFIITLIDSDIPKADYAEINANGKLTTAVITDIETQSNVTINNEHPSIISYKYFDGGNETTGVYRSLDPDKINRMDVGDTVQVKYMAGGSMIVGLDSFQFPYYIILAVLIPFLIIGLVMLTILYLKIKGQLNLYKHGEVKDAEVVAITRKNGLPLSGIGHAVIVHYQYKTSRGQSILGQCATDDFAILNSKKQGDPIKIFVSMDDESKSCLIPRLEQIKNNWKIDW